MAMLTRFDLSSDMTAFYVFMFALLMIITVLLSRVSPTGKSKRGRGGSRVNDRFSNRNGELID